MRPKLTVALLIGVVAMGYGVYQTKYQVQALKERAATLEAEIAKEKAAIEVLKAEWAYLTRPTRLERLAEQHLDLGPVAPEQVAALDDLDRVLPRGDAIAENDNTDGKAAQASAGRQARFADAREGTR